MAVKVAINGFGRIGRNILRAIVESGRTDIEVVAINDLGPVETNAHLLRYDSVHGKFPATVTTGADWIDVGRGHMLVTALKNPADLPWSDVDIVLECTGIFTSKEKCLPHLENGSKRVLIHNNKDYFEAKADKMLFEKLTGISAGPVAAGARQTFKARFQFETQQWD